MIYSIHRICFNTPKFAILPSCSYLFCSIISIILALSEVAAITKQGRVSSINCNRSYHCPFTRSMS